VKNRLQAIDRFGWPGLQELVFADPFAPSARFCREHCYDPHIAALSYDQMMRKGKHHTQAVCACATHVLERVLAVVRADKAYELRDVDGTALTGQQARERRVEHDMYQRRCASARISAIDASRPINGPNGGPGGSLSDSRCAMSN